MPVTIRKAWRFDAAHRLPNHDGKCAQPHGHTYTVTVEVHGIPAPTDGRPDEGMVVDFCELDRAWKELEPRLDHRDLNATLADEIPRTTSEHLAMWLLHEFGRLIDRSASDAGRHVTAVTVSETPSTSATAHA